MHDIARVAGVSVSTVSRALRDDSSVALATQQRIRGVAAQLDYRLNTNASRLRGGSTQTVAMAVPALNDWYFAELIAGAQTVLNANGFDTVAAVVSEPEALSRMLSDADRRSGRFDGVVVVDMRLDSTVVDELRDAGTMVVTTGRALPHFSSVMIDDIEAARLATAHLIGLGHRRIGVIKGRGDGPYGFDVPHRRMAGFLQAFAEAGLEPTGLEAVGNFALVGGYEAAKALFENAGDPPTALFCMSDRMALGAIRALRDLSVAVPESVSVIGIDDHQMAESFGLTTVRQPVRQIGAAAARLMVDQLHSDSPPITHAQLPTQLLVRRTTRRLTS